MQAFTATPFATQELIHIT